MNFNLREIMLRAWRNYHKDEISFSKALHRAWISEKAIPINAARIEAGKLEAGIVEEVNTWAGWREAGREVVHGEKALFGVNLIWGSKGDNATYKARFFGLSQTKEVAA